MRKEELARDLIELPIEIIGIDDGTDLRAVNLEIGATLLFVIETAAAYALRNDELNKDDLIATLSLEIGSALSAHDFEYVSDRFIEYATSVSAGGDVTSNQLDSFVASISKAYLRQVEALVPTSTEEQLLASSARLIELVNQFFGMTIEQVDSAIAAYPGEMSLENQSADHTGGADSLAHETAADQEQIATSEDSDSDLPVSVSPDDSCRVFVEAAGANQVSKVKYLIETGVDPNAIYEGYTALEKVLVGWKRSEEEWVIVRTLLEHGAELPDGCVYRPAESGDVGLVEFLADRGADISSANSVWGWTPLEIAVQYGRTDVVRLLISRGADPNSPGMAESLDRLYDKWPEDEFQEGRSIAKVLAGQQKEVVDRESTRKWWQFWR